MFCINCGKQLNEGDMFCDQCGSSQSNDTPINTGANIHQSYTYVSANQNQYEIGFWINIMKVFANLSLLVIIGTGAYFGYQIFKLSRNFGLFIGFILGSIIIGMITVGFTMIMLNMAADIKLIRKYLIKDQNFPGLE